MDIVSWQFATFSVCVLLIYYFLALRAQNVWLLITSYIFYFSWGLPFAVILFFVTALNFFISRRLGNHHARRRLWFWAGVGGNALLLFFFKFVTSDYGSRLFQIGFPSVKCITQFLLPIGLAFYTLQAISYLIDVYNGQMPAASSFVDFALCMSYFPKLIAGPIERARNFLPKLAKPRMVTNETLSRSFTLIIIGLIRKIVIADVLPRMISIDHIWSGMNSRYATPEMALWLIVYAFSLYNDFAGYTSIVRGVSGLFGIELSPNFQQPFFARSFTEFWNRWHISLSHWLRDYIYFPFSRALLRRSEGQRNLINIVLPPLITMMASGLWHGFSVSMLVWGGLHGLYQVVERIPFVTRMIAQPDEQPRWRQAILMLIVFLLTMVAWVPFALKSLQGNAGALAFWNALILTPHWGFSNLWFLVVLFPFALSLWIDAMQYRARNETVFTSWSPAVQGMLLALALTLFFIFGITSQMKVFVYQGF